MVASGEHPFDGHFLVLTWAEDYESPTWFVDGELPDHPLDWEVTHPPTCKGHMEQVQPDLPHSGYWVWECFYSFEIDNIGNDAFGSGHDWPMVPCVVPLAWEISTVGWETPETIAQIIEGTIPEGWVLPSHTEWRPQP